MLPKKDPKKTTEKNTPKPQEDLKYKRGERNIVEFHDTKSKPIDPISMYKGSKNKKE